MIRAQLAKRIARTGALSGRPQAFSEEKISFRASLLPESGSLQAKEYGLKSGKRIRLLADSGLDAKAGDGVYIGDDFFIVQSVMRWTAHIELLCGAAV